jgi:choline dehydrogenase
VTQAFIDSAVGLGKRAQLDVSNVPSTADIAGQQDINVDDNMPRISAAHGYLLPALSRGNLTLLTLATVTKLDIGGGQCRGVVVSVAGEERRFAAAKEMIVCGGGLQSPKLLMLSGIGPADHLRAQGIAVAADSPGVGASLHDHLLVRLVFSTKQALPPQVDTGHAGITYHKSKASLAARYPDLRAAECAERAGPQA